MKQSENNTDFISQGTRCTLIPAIIRCKFTELTIKSHKNRYILPSRKPVASLPFLWLTTNESQRKTFFIVMQDEDVEENLLCVCSLRIFVTCAAYAISIQEKKSFLQLASGVWTAQGTKRDL